jgi:hypothetical protein
MQLHVDGYRHRHGRPARPTRSTRSLFVDQLPDGRWAQWWAAGGRARDWYVVDQQVWQRQVVPLNEPVWTRLDPATGRALA